MVEILSGIDRILDRLQLTDCDLEKSPVTGELGWRAPKGRIFRVTGQFTVDSDVYDIADRFCPQESTELLKSNNLDLYNKLLRRYKGDNKKALKALIEEIQDYEGELSPPTSFKGKLLVIRPNIDGSPSLIGESPGERSLLVKKDVYAWCERAIEVIDGAKMGGIRKSPIMFDAPNAFIKWRQKYAEAVMDHCEVGLVQHKDPIPRLYVPDQTNRDGLFLPLKEGTSDDYFKHREKMTGEVLDESQKAAIIRSYRDLGWPFCDDDLANAGFVRAPRPQLILPEEPRILRPGEEKRRKEEDLKL